MPSSSAFTANMGYIEEQFQQWQEDPASVSEEWRGFFAGFSYALETQSGNAMSEADIRKQSGVQSLIYRYRDIGHLLACTDPLNPCPISHPLLDLETFGLDSSDLNTHFYPHTLPLENPTLQEIIDLLKKTYCRSVGVEFMYIQNPQERTWLQQRLEKSHNETPFAMSVKRSILKKLMEATLFETFIHRKFLGQKRFSLEGGETIIPILESLVLYAIEHGVQDLALGMAHRGRLNILANIFEKPKANIFSEFADNIQYDYVGEGDVKYHKGFSTDISSEQGTIHLTMASNPSHLEAVNPVVIGKSRARQDDIGKEGPQKVLPVLLHGDAAFAGQGITPETLNLSGLEGYATGGSIHLIINNQIGFTTLPQESRSSHYATDVAKMLSVPIFHVHGEDPEAAVHAIRLALDYRQTFGKDVVLEIICYRKHGHNEGDEPLFTQPLMYEAIKQKRPVHTIYADRLVAEGLPKAEVDELEKTIIADLESAMEAKADPKVDRGYLSKWSCVKAEWSDVHVETGVATDELKQIAETLMQFPEGFAPHPKVEKLLLNRRDAVLAGEAIDWGTAETLAYASLLKEGDKVRISGQDCQRGTFNHRHATISDRTTARKFSPLSLFARGTHDFQVYNSSLSEAAVLGFEYGYSLESPDGLIIWEAQFGDFANGAQIIIDQFISSSESKWGRGSGVCMFLPHGYEGQGAEHSSARMERYLQLCANNNIQIAYPSTPAQHFHLLRRQLKQSFRRPLIVFTPKSLLRHPDCTSSLKEFTKGGFQGVITQPRRKGATTLALCSGKIYYELKARQQEVKDKETAIVRIEQLYPLHRESLIALVEAYPEVKRVCWVQEEPANAGAWNHIQAPLRDLFDQEPLYIGRPPSAAAAVGSHRAHKREQEAIINRLFPGKS